jgi:hypothetical protein
VATARSTEAADRPATTAVKADAHLCSNCGALALGAFCPECGQNTRERLPTFVQFMREATGRYLSFEGKLWKTLLPLLFRPGFLTRAYLAGRRQRYVGPARMFLVSSLLLFAVLGYYSNSIDIDQVLIPDKPSPSERAARALSAEQRAEATAKAMVSGAAKAPDTAKATDKPSRTGAQAMKSTISENAATVERTPSDDKSHGESDDWVALDEDFNVSLSFLPDSLGLLKKRVEHFNQLTRPQKAEQILFGALRFGPYAMFALLPAFAALLKVVYLGRRRKRPLRPRLYGEHLVFAAHDHTFLFIAVALIVALPTDVTRQLVAAWITFYLAWSMHAVYGGSWLGIAVRGFILFIVYSILFALVTVGLLVVAVLMR